MDSTPSLPIPDWDELFMRHAYLIASKSKDKRTQIGAVLVRDRRVISEGYNGMPCGVNDNEPSRQERPVKYFYFEHGERNAVFACARFGIKAAGSTLYTQGTPCADCCRAVIQAGVKEVVVHSLHELHLVNHAQWAENCAHGSVMLKEAGVIHRTFDKKLGVKILLNGGILEV